jgi:hypothetical protein
VAFEKIPTFSKLVYWFNIIVLNEIFIDTIMLATNIGIANFTKSKVIGLLRCVRLLLVRIIKYKNTKQMKIEVDPVIVRIAGTAVGENIAVIT